jgi:uncharacterized damage-inducible protein DinB
MTHPLVEQFRFTRSEWLRGLEGVSEDDAASHFGQMNCISWTVGHLAWHEHRTWLERAQNIILFPHLKHSYGFGSPMSTPSLTEVLKIWHQVTEAADPFLNSLTTQMLQDDLLLQEKPVGQTIGSALQRIIYHYWYHTGEVQAMRQMLGQKDLPIFVGDLDNEAPFKPA